MILETPEKVDVLIVGVGPAGSSAASVCAKAGLKVLAIEKRPEIGSPKRCAEGLSRSSLKRMGIELDEKCISQTVYGADVYAPNGKFIGINYEEPEGWILERKMLDKELAKHAARMGAKIYAKTELIDLERKSEGFLVKLKTENTVYNVETKILIACDGVESKTSRKVGLNTTLKLTDIASCAQFEMANVKVDNRIKLFFGNEIAAGGYVWIFPKGKDSANVGIGVRKPWAKLTAIEYLKKFVQNNTDLKNGSIIEVNSGGVPVGGLMEDMVMDNFIATGDAAHQVNPIHGGGIAEAYIGGRIAGDVAIKAVRENNYSKEFLTEYNRRWIEERGKKLNAVLKLRHVIESLTDEDLNWLVDYLKEDDLIDFTRGASLKKLALLLMKKPKLLKLASKLM